LIGQVELLPPDTKCRGSEVIFQIGLVDIEVIGKPQTERGRAVTPDH